MAPLTLGDVLLAARCLHPYAPKLRKAQCEILFRTARTAHIYRLRTGRCHGEFGDGSLGSAVLCIGPARRVPIGITPDFLTCLRLVIERAERQTCDPFVAHM